MNMQNRNKLTDVENKLVITKGEWEEGGTSYGYGINRFKLLYLKHIGKQGEDTRYSTADLYLLSEKKYNLQKYTVSILYI